MQVEHGRKYASRIRNCSAISHRSKVIFTSSLLDAILKLSSRTTSGNVCSDTVKPSMVGCVGIGVGIAAPSLAAQKLFPLPVLLAAILNFGSLLSSTNVGQPQAVSSVSKSKLDDVENVGTAFGIASQSTTVQKLFPVQVLWPPS